MVRDYCVNEARGLNEAKEGVSCPNNVAVLVLEFGHKAGYEDDAACDRKRKGKDRG